MINNSDAKKINTKIFLKINPLKILNFLLKRRKIKSVEDCD